MAKLNASDTGTFKDWQDGSGNIMHASDYKQERLAIITGHNDLEDTVTTNKTDADTKHDGLDSRVTTAENDIDSLQSRATTIESTLPNKTDLTGDHAGTWHGLLPSQANESIASQVQANTNQIGNLSKMFANVLSFSGIDSTGVNDSTVAIQNAINSLTNGGTVFFPPGNYKTIASINVPSNIALEFAEGAKIINSSDNSVFIHTSDTANANITIRNAYIEGNHSGSAQYAIMFSSVKNVIIENCLVNYTARGIRLDDCADFLISGNTLNFNGFTASASDQCSILVQGTSTGTIIRNTVYDGTGQGIEVNATGDINIVLNKCWRNSGTGIIAAGVTHYRMIISENNCCYNGTVVTSGADGGINVHGLTNGLISKNICSFNHNYGIDVNGDPSGLPSNRTTGLLVDGNIVTDNSNIGIYIWMSKYTTVSNNMCRNNYANIQVGGTATDTMYIDIINNKCYDSTFATANIYITQGDHITIDGNICGEIDSTSTTTNELRIESAVTNVVMGWNDFTLAKRARNVVLVNSANVSFKHLKTFISDEITLSGASYNSPIPINPPSGGKYSAIVNVYLVYTEASSTDVGVVCGIGAYGQTNTYWGSVTTQTSATKGSKQTMPLNLNGQITDTVNQPYFYCAGGKTGLGKVKIVLEYVPSLPIYY